MRAVRLVLAGLGVAAMGYALWMALASPDLTPTRNATFLLLIVVLHDGLLLPLFLVAGLLVHRLVPPRPRAIVQAALIVTASVTLVALPLVLGYGRTADNPSALPLDYGRGLLLTLVVIWLAAAVAAGALLIRSAGRAAPRRGRPGGPGPPAAPPTRRGPAPGCRPGRPTR